MTWTQWHQWRAADLEDELRWQSEEAWHFEVGGATAIHGDEGSITLSREYIRAHSEDEVFEAIRHLMTHALAGHCDHGNEFQRAARFMGSTTSECPAGALLWTVLPTIPAPVELACIDGGRVDAAGVQLSLFGPGPEVRA